MAEGGSVDSTCGSTFDFLCTNCSEDGYNSEAVNYCIQCESYFCSKCIKMHSRLPATKNHDLLDKDKLREGMEKQPISELTGEDEPGDNIADIIDLEKLRVTDRPGEAACRPEITEEERNSIKTAFLKYGVNGVKRYIEKGMNQWKTVVFNIAITGTSGAGKSSYINAIRGLTAEDEGAAATGLVETTIQPKRYIHPKNRNCVFWDLPGVGTENFKAETYLNDVCFETYDFFILLISSRFTENDMMLAKSVQDQGKRCFLVRTKIDVELNNEKKAHAKTFNRDKLLLLMRRDCVRIIEKNNLPCQVYLIDNNNKLDFDFGLLLKDIMNSSLSLYREAFTLSISAVTDEVIEEKRKVILARAQRIVKNYLVAICALTVLSLGLVHDSEMLEGLTIVLLRAEVKEFRVQFGLTGEDLGKHSELLGISLEDLKKKLNLSIQPDEAIYEKQLRNGKMKYIDTDCLFRLTGIIRVTPVLEEIIERFESFLNCMVKDAKTINRLKTSRLVEKSA